jgi:large subunit ribosomal protein L31
VRLFDDLPQGLPYAGHTHKIRALFRVPTMKQDIHPDYQDIKATCSCGNVVETRSTLSEDIHLEVCSACHPFYTGKQKILDAGGRVERFRKRFGNRSVGS